MTTPTNMSPRKFGVEIEFKTPLSQQEISDLLNNAGLSAVTTYGSNKTTSSSWKVATDGSLTQGFEIVSPVLCGEDGIRQIHKVCEIISGLGMTVDRSCGLHVHVDVSDLRDVDILHIVTRYSTFESEIDSWMPRSRRASVNGTCGPATGTLGIFQPDDFKKLSGGQIRQRLGTPDTYDRRRYSKVNLCPFIRQGTVEFRHHSGTVNATKIENWVRFVVAFTEASKVKTVSRSVQEFVPVGPDGRVRRTNSILTKFELLANLLECNYSVSTAMIAATLDISESSVPSYMSNFRNKYNIYVKCSPRTGEYRSYESCIEAKVKEINGLSADGPVIPATRMVTREVTEADVSVGTIWDGIPLGVQSFYKERAMELA
jgi:hypothetical protein